MSGDIAKVYGGYGFDTQNGEGMESFDPLPAGWYGAVVDEAAVCQTRNGNGWYLKLRFYILDAQYNGRRVYTNINLRNPNSKAEEIGQRELTTLGRALGLPMITDSAECLDKQLSIKLKITHDEAYGDKNDVTGYRPLEAAPQAAAAPTAPPPASRPASPPPAAQAPQPAPASQPAAAPAAGARPWEQRR